MEISKPYAFGKTVAMSFADAEKKVREELLQEGFGILTEIDVKKKFAEKLQRDFREYIILGACNPAMAYEAFGKELDIGTLLPCNVIVYTRDDGKTAVVIMDPEAALSLIANSEVSGLAKLVKQKMEKVLGRL